MARFILPKEHVKKSRSCSGIFANLLINQRAIGKYFAHHLFI